MINLFVVTNTVVNNNLFSTHFLIIMIIQRRTEPNRLMTYVCYDCSNVIQPINYIKFFWVTVIWLRCRLELTGYDVCIETSA